MTRPPGRWGKRLAWVGVPIVTALVLAVAVLAAMDRCGGETTAQVYNYRLGPGPRQITLIYVIGPIDKPGHAEVVRQAASEVVVRATYTHTGRVGLDLGIPQEATVDLSETLGNRRVLDQDGNEVVVEPTPVPENTSTSSP